MKEMTIEDLLMIHLIRSELVAERVLLSRFACNRHLSKHSYPFFNTCPDDLSRNLQNGKVLLWFKRLSFCKENISPFVKASPRNQLMQYRKGTRQGLVHYHGSPQVHPQVLLKCTGQTKPPSGPRPW